MKRALLIGRYQPPHMGHVKMIQGILEECDELVIVVAAAQMSFSKKNPFTAGERLQMVRAMLFEYKIDYNRIWLIPTQDVLDNDIWVTHVLRMCPPIDVVYGNNPFTDILFDKAGIKVTSTPLFKREKYEARQIREALRDGIYMPDVTPSSVIKILKEINAIKRLQALHGTDSSKFNDSSSEII